MALGASEDKLTVECSVDTSILSWLQIVINDPQIKNPNHEATKHYADYVNKSIVLFKRSLDN